MLKGNISGVVFLDIVANGIVSSSIVEGGESSINSSIENLYYIETTKNPIKTHQNLSMFSCLSCYYQEE